MGRMGFTFAIAMAGIVIVAMGLTASIAFACLALYFYLATVTSPAFAALGVALAALLFVVLVAVAMSVLPRPKLLPSLLRENDFLARAAEALSLGQHLGDEGRDFLKANLSKTSAIAFGLGIVMGISPKLRKAVLDLLLR